MPNEDEKMQMLSKFLRDDPSVRRGTILPMLERTTADPIDDVSEENQYEFAVPDLFRMPLRSIALAGSMASGATPFMQDKVTEAALDSMGLGYGITGLFGGVPRGALGANVWHGGPNSWKPEVNVKKITSFKEFKKAAEGGKIHQAKGRSLPGEESAKTPLRMGLINDYPIGDIAHFYAKRRGYGRGVNTSDYDPMKEGYKEFLADAKLEGFPVFPKGRPRLDRIGTGEGAQAYGHGFYSADAKAVAETYKDAVKSSLFVEGKNVLDGNGYVVKRFKHTEDAHDFVNNQASLKKLDLPDEDIAKMLDWDAPLSEQPKAVQEIARLYNIKTTPSGMKEARGSDIYRAISQAEAKPPFNTASRNPGSVEGSEALRKAGIPGLKYYDQMSRHPSGNAPKDTAARILQATGGNRKNAIEETKKRIARSDSKVDSNLKSALEILEGKEQIGTRNYVTWDQDVLDRVKILESNGVQVNANASPVGMAGLLMNRRSLPDTSLPTSGKYPVVDDRGNLMYNASTLGGFI